MNGDLVLSCGGSQDVDFSLVSISSTVTSDISLQVGLPAVYSSYIFEVNQFFGMAIDLLTVVYSLFVLCIDIFYSTSQYQMKMFQLTMK